MPTLIFAHNSPEEVGLLPDGINMTIGKKENDSVRRKSFVTTVDWGTRQALKTRSLWLIALFGISNMVTVNILTVHQVAYLEDIGISPMLAASVLGLTVGTSSGGRIIAGILGDRFEQRHLIAIACTMQVIGLIILINARTMAFLYIYVLIFGIAYGALLVLGSVMVGSYYGRKNYPLIRGISFLPGTVIGVLAPIFAGFMFDNVGSYVIPLSITAAFCAISGIGSLFAKPPVVSKINA